jgi:hypothetical protein
MSILGMLGIAPSEADETSDLPHGAPRGRAAERILAAELLQEIRRLGVTMTEYSERIAAGVVNHVLEVGTRPIGTDGYHTRAYKVPVGSIEVRNLGQHDMRVVNSAPGPSAPDYGIGVYVVPPGCTVLVNIASHNHTVWGTAGDIYCYQAFTRGGDVRPSLSAVDGGTP